uniref:BED-type domain-containing protein n=1 Tax=Cannabis sativa TaxID=3483 RepID=A0A803P7E6_CANSA
MVIDEMVDESTPSPEVNQSPTETPNEDENKDKSKGKKRGKSPTVVKDEKGTLIWEHFTKLEPTDPEDFDEDVLKYICKYCDKDFTCDCRNFDTSHLWNHFNNGCEFSPAEEGLDKKQKVSRFELVKGRKEGETSLANGAYNKEACSVALEKYIVLDELSSKHVEGEGFKQFVRTLQPRFEIPSRKAVAKSILKLYEEEKAKLKDILKHESVSIAVDTWTSIQNLSYMVITAHWIDCDYKFRKRIINFCQLVDHTEKKMKLGIWDCLNDWGITKLVGVTLNDSSFNDAIIKYLIRWFKDKDKSLVLDGKFLHVRCSAYIMNLIVSEGLAENYDSIAAIRNAVRFVRSSQSRLDDFKENMKLERIECNSLLCLDVETNWYSTLQMLTCALKFRKVFERMKSDENYLGYFNEVDKDGKPMKGPPSEIDWENVLDPRYKLRYLKHCFSYFHDPNTTNEMVKRVEQIVQAMYDHYGGVTTSFDQFQSQAIVVRPPKIMFGRPMSRSLHDEFVEQRKARESGWFKNEVDRYFSEDVECIIKGQTFDVLKWWAGNAGKYKILSLIARDVLAIPVATEAAFSIGSQILDPLKSSLNPKIVEALFCLKNWWSESHQPIIVREYIDEAEVLETSKYL